MPRHPIPRRGPQNAFTRRLAKISDWELTSIFSRPYSNRTLARSSSTCTYRQRRTRLHQKSPSGPRTVEARGWQGTQGTSKDSAQGRPATGWTFQTNQVLTSKLQHCHVPPEELARAFRRVANIFPSWVSLSNNDDVRSLSKSTRLGDRDAQWLHQQILSPRARDRGRSEDREKQRPEFITPPTRTRAD